MRATEEAVQPATRARATAGCGRRPGAASRLTTTSSPALNAACLPAACRRRMHIVPLILTAGTEGTVRGCVRQKSSGHLLL